jgi:prepilin-type N-terminal cleavage/methylation domain-containing protein/prepilin-type processing-associated H-X9-DG protein
MEPSNRGHAFSLVELLIVIAVIAVLASLLLPSLSRGKARAVRIQCASNLKEIGLAIEMYLNESEDRLPGPVWMGQPFQYDQNETNALIFFLWRDLGLPLPSALRRDAPIFLCPGYTRLAPPALPGVERVSMMVNPDIDPDPANTVRPFGYPGRPGDPPEDALKAGELEHYSPARAFALVDADKRNAPLPGNPWWGQLPGKPVHGTMRNTLYFDWHVDGVQTP